jgi:glycosyltransferase involved in cell wall biosynthesis
MERAGVHVPVKVIPVPVTLGSEQLDLLGEVLVSDKPDTELVLFVGRLVDEKALRTWLRVAKEVAARRPSARFRMVGDGPCRGELERELRTLGLSEILELSGHRPNIALAAHYREAAVFLLSSEAEGFGRVLVEASRFGAALVSTRVAGAEDIIRAGETGLMAEVGDVATLAHHVAGLLADPEGRRRMAETAFADLRQRFHPDELASRWAAFLVEVAQGGAGT